MNVNNYPYYNSFFVFYGKNNPKHSIYKQYKHFFFEFAICDIEYLIQKLYEIFTIVFIFFLGFCFFLYSFTFVNIALYFCQTLL